MPPLPPGRLGRWRLGRLLGAGAAAQVFLAEDAEGRRAAVKRLHSRAAVARERFAREAEALARLDHPGIVRLLDADLTAGAPWLAMTAIEGPSLEPYADTLRRRPPRERVGRTQALGSGVAGALAALHAAGLVHRDVKPRNILLGPAGQPFLIDLGLVAGQPPGFPGFELGEAPGRLLGTPSSAAPEQLRGEAGPATDQYGLGCTLHLLLTGRRVFADREGGDLLDAHRHDRPPPPSRWDPSVPPDLDTIVLRLLEKDPADRFASMEEVRDALLAGGTPPLPLAGRQEALDHIAALVRAALAGRGAILHFAGAPGSGRRWLASIARDAADRAGVEWVDAPDSVALERASTRIAAGEAVLVLSAVPSPAAATLHLGPLSLADVRRSLHAIVPDVTSLARTAEHLHRGSGGNAGLLLRLLQPGPPDLSPWLAGLSPDALRLAGALAVTPEGLDPAGLDAPSRAAGATLVDRGVAVAEPGLLRLAAEVFREALLPHAPAIPPAPPAASGDPEHVRELLAALLSSPPGDPLPLARSLVSRADALGEHALRSASRATLAWLLWEQHDLPGVLAVAADASAAARAAGDVEARLLSHVLRAAATLAAGPPDRVRASAALDRLVTVDPRGAAPPLDALWHLTRAGALDALGDARSAESARHEARRRLDLPDPAPTPLHRRIRAFIAGEPASP